MYDPRLHLFVDHHGIASSRNVELIMGQPRKHGSPVVKQDRPWESHWICAWGSVFRSPETGKLRMWYESIGFQNTLYVIRTCLAESSDGIHWDKPNLGCYSCNGSEETNIVLAAPGLNRWHSEEQHREGEEAWRLANVRYLGDGPPLDQFVTHYDGTNVVYDQKEPDPARRYKWIGWMERRDEGDKTLNHHMLAGPDGIHWDMKPERLTCKVNDGTKVQWDPIGKRWSLTYLVGSQLESGENIRSFGLTESEDLSHWVKQPPPIELDQGDDYGRQMQGHFILPFAYGDQYLGFASMIHTKEGWTQSYLVSSRDGRTYERLLRRDPFLRIGGDEEFDADSAEIAIGAPILIGDYLYLYYTGRSRRHWAAGAATGAIGLLTLKRDRFAGFTNGMWFNRNTNNLVSNGGEVVTKPVEVTGGTLSVNGKTRETRTEWGLVRAELLDESRKPIPGYTAEECLPFRGDEVRAAIRWSGRKNTEGLRGRKVSVRFLLNMATLYAYVFE